MKNNDGFSLIELMIVVVIIGILSAIAIPSYQSYTERARFAEVVSATEVFKTAVALALQQGINAADLLNGSNGIPDEPPPTKNIASIQVLGGIIQAVATKILHEVTYILTPDADGSHWNISGTCVNAGLCNF
ncbi:MAG TPA: prepilin-type N-terminal cleavage/methylation domain-containing protein [Gammaproteobacteria bacterium]|nr:prepilin-type N-terminal cleavage/methylation domain-containing protein [Gammaproteobacteria bacterium]